MDGTDQGQELIIISWTQRQIKAFDIIVKKIIFCEIYINKLGNLALVKQCNFIFNEDVLPAG